MVSKVIEVKEAAARLGLHPETLLRKLRTGQVPGRKVGTGGRWRIPAVWVEGFER